MKTGIVTIYNSQCAGSFLQAIATYHFLESHGIKVAFVDNGAYKKSKFLYQCVLAAKYFVKGQYRNLFWAFRTYFAYRNIRKGYATTSSKSLMDACVFGSDTIWNIEQKEFRDRWEFYWGKNISCRKIVYAASIGSSKPEKILPLQDHIEALEEFSAYGVRDSMTRELIERAGITAKIHSVVDPTMLMPASFYKEMVDPCDEVNYILFYFYGCVEDGILNEIMRFANEKGLSLICFGQHIPGCKKNLIFEPITMLRYFQSADYIITNTFHGNIFSIIFNKNFVNVGKDKAKVQDLQNQFQLIDRSVQTPAEMRSTLEKQIDYSKVNETLNTMREASREFLLNSIRGVQEH